MNPTKAHNDYLDVDRIKQSIRIGNKVPENAVNLAYYYNLGSNGTSKNVLAVASPKNTIDHMEIEQYRKLNNLPSKDESKFVKSLEYKDADKYIGTLLLTGIEWFEHIEVESKFCSINKEYTNLNQQTVPESIEHSEGRLNGTLHLKKEVYTATKYEDRPVTETLKKNITKIVTVNNLGSPSHNFSNTINVKEDDYSGVLKIVPNSIKYIEQKNDSNIIPVVITDTIIGPNPSYPTSKSYSYGGKTYNIPLTSVSSTTKELKHYGTSRYWGYGLTGLYGTKDWKYAATAAGGKGYFKDNKAPAQIANRWDHFCNMLMEYRNFTVKSAYTGWRETTRSGSKRFFYPDEQIVKINGKPYSGKYNSVYNYETCYNVSGVKQDMWDGTEWELDIAKAASFGAPNNLTHGGCVWAGQYANYCATFPPPGYENDPIHRGNQHMWFVYNNRVVKDGKAYYSGTINVEGVNFNVSDILKINNYAGTRKIMTSQIMKRNFIFTNVTRCNQSLAYPGNQQYSRMTLQFYKGRTKSTTVTYSANIVVPAGKTWTAKCEYEGELSKTETTFQTVPVEWKCNATYDGVIKYSYPLYDGLATYRGIVIKRNAVGNLNPEGLDISKMYPNADGILFTNIDDKNSDIIEGQNFMITDVYYEDEPLYYSYMLEDYIYDTNGPNEANLYSGNSIKLVDENNRELRSPYKYKVKLLPTKYKHLYKGFVFTSFETFSNKNIYCVYNAYKIFDDIVDVSSENFISGKKELIFVQPAYQINKDFKVIEADRYRNSKIKVFDFVYFKDYRRKIPITYVVKTTDGKYTSKPIYANIINKQYAFESELKEFEGNNHIISPQYEGIYLSAIDILVRDLNINSWELEGKQFVVDFFESEASRENYTKVYLYTKQDGSGYVLAETSEETGFLDEKTNEYTKKYNFDAMYKYHNNYVYSAFTVKNKDIKSIVLSSPDENDNLLSWYPRIKFGNFSQTLEQHNAKTKITYAIPEFSRQYFNATDGEPYKYVEDEQAKIISEYEIQVSKTPLFVKYDEDRNILNLYLYKKNILGNNEKLTIESWSYKEGIVRVKEYLNDTDEVYVNYTYEEEYYIYRGFYDEEGGLIDIDLNPGIYHDYLDTSIIPYTRQKSHTLFNKVIYFFIKPKTVEDIDMNTVFIENESVIYHKFDTPVPEGEYDLLIGKIYVRHNTSLKSTVLVDTRVRGGGVLTTIYDSLRRELEPESDYYFDIGYYDGEMYPENSVVVLRLDKNLLVENGGKFTKYEIERKANKWISFGVYPMIEYVDAIHESDLPSNIEIEPL